MCEMYHIFHNNVPLFYVLDVLTFNPNISLIVCFTLIEFEWKNDLCSLNV